MLLISLAVAITFSPFIVLGDVVPIADAFDVCQNETLTLNLPRETWLSSGFIVSPSLRCIKIRGDNINIENGTFDKVSNLLYLDLNYSANSAEYLFSFGSLPNVRILNLGNQNIYNQVPLKIERVYPELWYLNLQYANIYDIRSTWSNPFPKLTHLDLSGNRIKTSDLEIFPDTLTYLNLTDNYISQLSFPKFSNLTSLILDNNILRGIGGWSGLDLRGLRKLQNLSVANNQISWISVQDATNIRYLNLAQNSLSNIDYNDFRSMKLLEVLILDNNLFPDVPSMSLNITTLSLNCNSIRYLNDSLSNLPYLRKLFLNGNNITRINENTFDNHEQLEELHLADNQLTYLPPNWSRSMKNLRNLILSGNKFTSLNSIIHSADLPIPFNDIPNLKCLNMAKNKIPLQQMQINHNSLKTLIIDYQSISETNDLVSGDEDEIKMRLPNLETLSWKNMNYEFFTQFTSLFHKLTHVYFSDSKLQYVNKNISLYFPNLNSIHLERNLIDNLHMDCGNIEAIYLDGNPLKKLQFDPNQCNLKIISLSSCLLEDVLSFNVQSLRVLDLSRNRIGYISDDAFRYTPFLEKLNLSRNKLKSFPYLQHLNSLTTLCLDYNLINDIRNVILVNSLKMLSLRRNLISRIDEFTFSALTNLEYLDLAENNLHYLPPNWGQNLKMLTYLNLETNYFENIEDMMLHSVVNLEELYIKDSGVTAISLESLQHMPKCTIRNKQTRNDDDQVRQQYKYHGHSGVRNRYNPPTIPTFSTPRPCQTYTTCPTPVQYVQCTPNAVLNLTHMGLKRIGDSFIFSPDTKELYLDDNEITDISVAAFTSLKRLEILSLSGNNISIGKMLSYKSHEALQKLILNNNKYNGEDTSIEKIFEPLRRLQHLSLRRNGISQLNIVMKDFAPYLNSLDLSGNKLESINVNNFPETIAYLYLDDNKFTNLNLNNLNINELSLSGNKFQELCDVNCVDSWLSLKGKTKLSKLNVSHNIISNMKDGTFANMKSLVTLDLSHNRIVSVPNDIFNELSSLKELRINHNLLIIIPNICSLGYIKHLNISNNRITEVTSTYDG
ncbi:PREDICTED: leucine-rich repeat and death domain-containing protein 1-like [Eufriesea mexicana]|uniref:leucine-rich repeat and death domain-containing protein 1-like n=1 Tax=Eufriesea mexicana TaxID=516756 RepID=UPI00083C173B|nr:PREDICTED: leucine-rich repeat and death domain-containing protein 1-like [Eufriesea mexicana]